MKFSYLQRSNIEYIEQLFQQYLDDPSSVDESWRYLFEGMELGAEGTPTPSPSHSNGNGATPSNGHAAPMQAAPSTPRVEFDLSAEAKVAELITAYRERGRLLANVDPLNSPPKSHPLLELGNFGLTPADLEKNFTAGKLIGLGPSSLSKIIERLREIYCSSIGVEVTHIQDPIAREWLMSKMENSGNREELSAQQKKNLLKRVSDSETFERFIHTRYIAQKRFSLEGGESLIPALDRVIEVSSELGTNNIVMGMAHRGRLNVLHNIFGKKAEYILTEFEQNYEADQNAGAGDVKYHMGFSADITTALGKPVHLSLAHNPSHLEFVNPIVEGVARAKQRDLNDTERNQVIPILIHGDAAFSGQGVIYETINLSQLEGFTTGGTIHIVIDNQIGFTTDPKDSRSTTYSTDIAKMLEVPIFHVNGDDPEAVYYVARLCTEYRQKFKRDVFIDLICYRKYGHNEGDEPAFTQPVMYKKIKTHPSTRDLYSKKLIGTGVLDEAASKKFTDDVIQRMTQAQELIRKEKTKPFVSAYASKWKGLKPATEADIFRTQKTAIPKKTALELGKKLYQFPDGFKPHPKLAKQFDLKLKAIESGEGMDWGNVELLAYASLLAEGHNIRLSGQDVQRGTFSHRHSVVHDPETGQTHCSLNHLKEKQGEFIVFNSNLSETAVLGFEYGWSLADPTALVIWEAQFGDFANGAQVIIDQFIASSESKWQRASGIVLYLPHGYEGQGPEHSSARLERFLQLGAENNMAVCNFTTPAQLFHAVRRQLKREFRKPMVVMTPKSLLRHPKAVSSVADLTEGSFQEVIDDPLFDTGPKAQKAKSLLFCTGKIYYELLEQREKAKKEKEVAIVRVEQLYPWPGKILEKIVKKYSKAKISWVQEEPQNQGAWTYIFSHWSSGFNGFKERVNDRGIAYIGRDISAAPAVGSQKRHIKEQKAIMTAAISIK